MAFICFAVPVQAQDEAQGLLNPTSFTRRSGTIGVGLVASQFDSYLSPNDYSGLLISDYAESWKLSKWGSGQLFEQSMFDTSVGLTVFGGGLTLHAMENASYALPWRVATAGAFRFYAGPELQLRVGALYNLRNSNNPTSIKAALHATAMGMVESSFHVRRTPVRMAYQLDMPLIGAFFSPDYSQSLYEIYYLGSKSPIIHVATPFNCLSTRHLLTADVTHRHSITRFMLGCDVYQWHTSNASFALRTFQLGIGYVINLYTLHPHEKASDYLPY